jgi:hypothetical protein
VTLVNVYTHQMTSHVIILMPSTSSKARNIDVFICVFSGIYTVIIQFNTNPKCIPELLKTNQIQNVCTGSV